MREVHFVASSLKDLKSFPVDARQEAGYALHAAQCGGKAVNAVPLVGYGGASVLEVVINHDGDTYRAVYTVKFKDAVYVLHAFQKKSKKGIKTPTVDKSLIDGRLKLAKEHYDEHYGKKVEGKRGKKA